MNQELPQLITFDGEARSGKGTIVGGIKDFVRDELGKKVMLIDAGQVFRVLVVAATRSGVDVDDAAGLDEFLSNENEAEKAVRLVKDVYHMEKSERDALLYTNEVGANSAKVGARPKSQEFKDELLKKWLRDAAKEGYEIVLLDGRALEETGEMLADEKLCNFVLGLYFTCDARVGARRTLGFANVPYEDLNEGDRAAVDRLVTEIDERNRKDAERKVQPIIPPVGAPRYELPDAPQELATSSRPMIIFDTSAEMTKRQMTLPLEATISSVLKK